MLILCAKRLVLVKKMRDRVAVATKFDDIPEIVCKQIKKYFETIVQAQSSRIKISLRLSMQRRKKEIFEAVCAAVDCMKDAYHEI